MPKQAAENFISQSESIDKVEEHGRGIIHDTFLVKLKGKADNFILQRINIQVFKRPDMIMHNLRLVCEHMHNQRSNGDSGIDPLWKMLRIIPAREDNDFFIDSGGGFWRALSFINGAYSLESIECLDNAREVGRALGIFHCLTSNLDPELLQDTLPGFHNIELYITQYDQAFAQSISRESPGAEKFCSQFVEDRRSWAPVLEHARKQNVLQVRTIHGDPKINNFMLENQSGKAVSIIDLDTVKSGLVLYDIGDCMRSCCNLVGEETDDLDTVRFDIGRCEAVLSGYICEANKCLTAEDFDFFFDAIRLIPFELGLRFFTDYMEGNRYFKICRPTQNLDRALVQFRLVESIEEQEAEIKALIEIYREKYQEK